MNGRYQRWIGAHSSFLTLSQVQSPPDLNGGGLWDCHLGYHNTHAAVELNILHTQAQDVTHAGIHIWSADAMTTKQSKYWKVNYME